MEKKYYILIFTIIGCIFGYIGHWIMDKELITDFQLNLIVEIIGIGITYILIERLLKIRETERIKSQRERLGLHFCTLYYRVVWDIATLMDCLLYAYLDKEYGWIEGRIGFINNNLERINDLNNISVEIFPIEIRTDIVNTNSIIESILMHLSEYENINNIDDKEIILDWLDISELIRTIIMLVNVLPTSIQYDFSEFEIPYMHFDEMQEVYNEKKEEFIKNRKFWQEKRKEWQ